MFGHYDYVDCAVVRGLVEKKGPNMSGQPASFKHIIVMIRFLVS